MDLQALSSMNEMLTNHLETMKKNSAIQKNSTANVMKKQNNSNITIARKGDPGYIQNFDSNNDGEITMEEFNEYCEKNGVSEKEKLKLMSLMGTAKTTTKMVDNASKVSKEEEKEEKPKTENESTIYAKKGDDKYNEAMDIDKNNIVTYKEYMDYCNEKANDSEKNNTKENKATQTYFENEHYDEEPNISVDAVA